MKRRPWDNWEPPSEEEGSFGGGASSQGGVARGGGGFSESDNEEEVPPTGSDAGEILSEFLLDAQRKGKMTAQDVCIIAHWAQAAGAEGLSHIAKGPGAQSGSYKRHLDSFLVPNSTVQTYPLTVPGHLKASGARQDVVLHVIPPHEIFADFCQKEGWIEETEVAKTEGSLPQNYLQNPIVKSARSDEIVVPMAVFIDGVQYAKRNSMVLITLQFALSQKIFPAVVLRKRLLCQCGCLGWCTLHSVYSFLDWSFTQMAAGKFPAMDHLGAPFAEDDPRAQKAGRRMSAKGIVLQFRADWAELVTRLGLRSWNHTTHPCFLCWATQEQLFQDMSEPTWKDKSWPDYCKACEEHEIHVRHLGNDDWQALQPLLESDVREKGSQGLALTSAYPKLGLKKGDRLEPTKELADWSSFFATKPANILFWRPTKQGAVKHRCALYNPAIGTDLQSCMAIDAMHTLCLGVFAQWIAFLMWQILDANLSDNQAADQHSRDFNNLKSLKGHLFRWYPVAEKQLKEAGHTLTRVTDITLSMLGSRTSPALHMKAAETLGVLRFLGQYLGGEVVTKIAEGEHWSTGTTSLLAFWNKMADAPRVVPNALQQDFGDYAFTVATSFPQPPPQNTEIPATQTHLFETIDFPENVSGRLGEWLPKV